MQSIPMEVRLHKEDESLPIAGGSGDAPQKGARARRLPRARPDWTAIEAGYRCAQYSLREMARRHGCTHSSIANRARREGWSRRAREPLRDRGLTPAAMHPLGG
jgi:hypothetical protein